MATSDKATSSLYPETSATQLTVVIPVTLKRGRESPEKQVANALKPGSSITKICLVAIPDSRDKKRSLKNCSLVAKWLEQHGSQLEELILMLDENEEAELIMSLFKCSSLRLTRLLVSAADIYPDFLKKLPPTLEVFSGHLGSHGDLAPFVALPKLHSLGVRCYPSKAYDDRWTTAAMPLALLHHPTLQCLLIDVGFVVEITDKKAMPHAPESKLKLIAISGGLSADDVHDLIERAPKLQHLCLRCSALPRLSDPDRYNAPKCIDVRSLKDLKALELGFPQLKVAYLGLTELQHLSAVLLCGDFGDQKPFLPVKLAKEADESPPELPLGEMIMRRATLPGDAGKFAITVSMALPHMRLITEPRLFNYTADQIAA